MTREEGARLAEEILGGKWDYAVKARAAWLWAERGWDQEEQTFTDLSRYEAMQDAELARRQAEYRERMALAAFSNAVTS